MLIPQPVLCVVVIVGGCRESSISEKFPEVKRSEIYFHFSWTDKFRNLFSFLHGFFNDLRSKIS